MYRTLQFVPVNQVRTSWNNAIDIILPSQFLLYYHTAPGNLNTLRISR